MGHNGGPPMGPEDMGGLDPNAMGDMSGPPQAPSTMGEVLPFPGPQQGAPPQPMPPAPAADPAKDFDLSDLDIRPVADPTAITDMQRMAKAQFKLKFIDDPSVNRLAILKSVWRDARIANPEEYIVERNPALEKQMQLQEALGQAELAGKQAEAQAKVAAAAKAKAEADAKAKEPETKARELDQRDRELGQRDIELAQERDRISVENFKADMEDADKEVRLIMEHAREQRGDAEKAHDTARDDHHRESDRAHAMELMRLKAAAKGDQKAASGEDDIAKLAASIQQMSANGQEKIADLISKALTGVGDSNAQIAAGLKAMAESIERSNKIALAPTELVKGADGKPAGSVKKL